MILSDVDLIVKLRDGITEHRRRYYELNDPIIPDFEYDRLYAQLVRLENQYPEYSCHDSPTNKVGYIVDSLIDGVHSHAPPMLSLSNIMDDDDELDAFTQKLEVLAGEPVSLFLEPKVDGLALSLIYVNGVLDRATTRGDGLIGDDVTAAATVVGGIPTHLPVNIYPMNGKFEVRGEVYMPKVVFDELNKHIESAGGKKFSTARNAAAGSMRLNNPALVKSRQLEFVVYNVEVSSIDLDDIDNGNDHVWNLVQANRLGFNTLPRIETKSNDENLSVLIDSMYSMRDKHSYETDGVVVKVRYQTDRNKIGCTRTRPKWAVAYKFQGEEVLTTIEDVEFQVSKSGTLTPVAKVSPVAVGGAMVSNVNLYSMAEIKRLGVKINSSVYVTRAGEVIPKITGLATITTPNNILVDIEYPEYCPICSSKVVVLNDKAETLQCSGTLVCKGQLAASIKHFVSKDGMDIQGLGSELVEKLIDSGAINHFAEIFYLTPTILCHLSRMGPTSAKKVLDAIEASKKVSLSKFIYALGIKGVGVSVANLLANEFESITALKMAGPYDLMNVFGVGSETAINICNFFKDIRTNAVLKQLYEAGVDPRNDYKTNSTDQLPLAGETWAVTGTFNGWTRREINNLLLSLGATVSGSVSSNTTHLIAGSKAGGKLKRAKQLNIPIMGETELAELNKLSSFM